MELALPPIENVDNPSFWSYIGHTDGTFYLCTKQQDMALPKYNIKIVALSAEGKLLSTRILEQDIDGKYLRYANHKKTILGSYINTTEDFYTFADRRTSYPTAGAATHLFLDPQTGNFIVSGLWGSEPMKPFKAANEGFFVHVYDAGGNIVVKKNHPLPQQLLDNKAFFANSHL